MRVFELNSRLKVSERTRTARQLWQQCHCLISSSRQTSRTSSLCLPLWLLRKRWQRSALLLYLRHSQKESEWLKTRATVWRRFGADGCETDVQDIRREISVIRLHSKVSSDFTPSRANLKAASGARRLEKSSYVSKWGRKKKKVKRGCTETIVQSQPLSRGSIVLKGGAAETSEALRQQCAVIMH